MFHCKYLALLTEKYDFIMILHPCLKAKNFTTLNYTHLAVFLFWNLKMQEYLCREGAA